MTCKFSKQLQMLIDDAQYFYFKSIERGDVKNARHYERRLNWLRGIDE